MSAAYNALVAATEAARKRGEDVSWQEVRELAERFGVEAFQAALRQHADEMQREASALAAERAIRRARGLIS